MRLPGSGNEIELRPAVSQQGRWYAYGQDGVRSGRGAESSPTQLHTSRGFSENLRRKIRRKIRQTPFGLQPGKLASAQFAPATEVFRKAAERV